jgi:CDP-diacylglycerol--glycerol-3-phosphate 3-phosphatidyltransferase
VPSVYLLKAPFQRFLRPLVTRLATAGVTANQLTIATCILSISLGLWLIHNPRLLLLLPAFFIIRMALNAMDGMLARDFNQISNLGAYLNELTDVVSDSFLYLPFAYLPGFDPLWIGAVIVLSSISELAGVLSTPRRNDGPMGKSDRALAFGAAAFWLGIGGKLAPWVSSIFPPAIVLLLILTIVNRVKNGLRSD